MTPFYGIATYFVKFHRFPIALGMGISTIAFPYLFYGIATYFVKFHIIPIVVTDATIWYGNHTEGSDFSTIPKPYDRWSQTRKLWKMYGMMFHALTVRQKPTWSSCWSFSRAPSKGTCIISTAALSNCFVTVGSIAGVVGSKHQVPLTARGLLVKSNVEYEARNWLKVAKLPAAGTF